MKILKLALMIVPAFKTIDYSKEAGIIIYTVNTSDKDWGDNFIQIEQNEKQQHTI